MSSKIFLKKYDCNRESRKALDFYNISKRDRHLCIQWLYIFRVYTSLYAVPYLPRVSLCRLDARFYFVLFRSNRNEFRSTSHSTCTRPLMYVIELHHFPLTRSSPFYAAVRSTPDGGLTPLRDATDKYLTLKWKEILLKSSPIRPFGLFKSRGLLKSR